MVEKVSHAPKSLQILAALGAAMMLISALVPWSTSESINGVQLHPFVTDAMRPSAIVVLLVAAVGLVLWLASRATAAIAGVASLMWLSCALLIWYFGIRLQLLLPGSLVPDGAVMSLEPGLYLAIAGSSLVLLVAFADALARFGQPSIGESMRPVRAVIGLGIVVGLLSSYGAPWFRIEILDRDWSVGLDAVPIVGDVVGPLLVLTGAIVAWWAVSPGRVVSYAMVVIGVGVTIAATLAGLSTEAAERGVRTTIRRIGGFQPGAEIAAAGVGPWLMACWGVASAALGALSLLRVDHGATEALMVRQTDGTDRLTPLSAEDDLPY